MALLKVICWALIFIIRIRFPPGKSLATILNMALRIISIFTHERHLAMGNISTLF